MPTLGGLLRKKRTKDSTTLSKEISSARESLADSQQTAETPNSPVDANKSSNPTQMNSAVAQPQPSSAPQQHQNVSNIHHLINHNDAQVAGGGNTGSHAQHQHQQQQQQQAVKTQPRQLKGKYSLEDFSIQRTLGTGSFGRVHLVQSKHNHRFYAIKVLKKAQVVKMKQVEHTNDERRMLQRVRHPFLITLWGTFQDSNNLYMVMDFVEGGELFSLLRKSQVSAFLCLALCGVDQTGTDRNTAFS